MRDITRKALTGIAALAAAGGVTAGIADAAKKKHGKKASKAQKRHAGDRHHRFGGPPGRPFAPPEELTGDAADKAKAAALDAVPGATVRAAFKAPDGGPDGDVAYCVLVDKSDDTHAIVLLDKDFKLVRTLDRPPGGPPGRPGGGPPNEPELTGDEADKAKAAALEAVPGGTVWRASKEDPAAENTGAAYEVHVRKSDGSEVEVLLDGDFKVVKTQPFEHHGPPPGGPHGWGGPPGPPPPPPPAHS